MKSYTVHRIIYLMIFKILWFLNLQKLKSWLKLKVISEHWPNGIRNIRSPPPAKSLKFHMIVSNVWSHNSSSIYLQSKSTTLENSNRRKILKYWIYELTGFTILIKILLTMLSLWYPLIENIRFEQNYRMCMASFNKRNKIQRCHRNIETL